METATLALMPLHISLDTVPVNKCFLENVPVNKVKRDLKPCVYSQKHIYQATTVTEDSEITEIKKLISNWSMLMCKVI